MFVKYFWIIIKWDSGFIVLAGVHSGLITSSCIDCTNDQIKSIRGCVKSTQTPVWIIDDYEFYICPITFLSLQIRFWYKKYQQIKNGICQQINYDKTSPKFFEAIDVYEYYLEKFREDKKDINKNDTSLKKLQEITKCQQKT